MKDTRTGFLLAILLPPSCSALAVPTRAGTVRTLGVDFGLRCCGVAVSSGFAPLPLTVLPCGGDTIADFEAVASAVARYAAGEGATQVVLGMPYNSSGGEGEQANITKVFAAKLADAVFPRPLFLWDERFSSAEASMRMNNGRGAGRGERVDAVAAAVILEDFFNADDDKCEAAPHVPSSRGDAFDSSKPPPPRPKIPTPPSQADVRRAMMERAAREEAKLRRSTAPKPKSAEPRGAVAAPAADSAANDGGGSSSRTRPSRKPPPSASRSKVDRYSLD